MRHFILTYSLILISVSLIGQNNDTWAAFFNEDTTLIGFRDSGGKIKIEPKFVGFTSANKFDDIIAVTEEIHDKWSNYYLTKSEKIVGRESLYLNDNSSDCENEGFIRFRDNKTDKAGMFNGDGEIVIPAEYDDLTRVMNGMIAAIKGAEKKYSEDDEHYSWVGGKELLIDTNNNVLIDNFKFDNNLFFYSLIVAMQPALDTIRQNFKTTRGEYYSFINFEKEFKTWLKSTLLENFTKDNLLNATYIDVTFWNKQNCWTSETQTSFINKNFELLKSRLLELNLTDCQYEIFTEGLNPYIFESDDYEEYFNNCGEPKYWINPVLSIIIKHKKKKDFTQDHFDFLRTDKGYKLMSVSIGNEEIK